MSYYDVRLTLKSACALPLEFPAQIVVGGCVGGGIVGQYIQGEGVHIRVVELRHVAQHLCEKRSVVATKSVPKQKK